MRKISIIFEVFFIFFSFSCQDRNVQNDNQSNLSYSDLNSPQVKRTFVEINSRQADDLIAGSPQVIVIDISDEFEQVHIKGAVSYPLNDGQLLSAFSELDKTKPYIVYGHDDTLSILGAQIMVDSGFNEVYRLSGDLIGWIVSGYWIARGSDQDHYLYYDLSPQQILELLEYVPNLYIIDFSLKFSQGHLPGAVNYPLSDSNLKDSITPLNKSLHYLVYAHEDSVSIPAAQMLVELEFPHVYRLKGNYSAWLEEDMEIEKEIEP
ncbi:MAG: rhodanese-like domain-containing protein [bacterium]